MPDFAYSARDMEGQLVNGSISAGSEREVAALLAGKSLFPVQVTVEKAARNIGWGRRVGGQLMANTYSQLASLLRAGVPLLRSLAVIRDQSSHRVLKQVLRDVYNRVEDGATLGDAMSRHENAFSDVAVNMVRAGGEGGFMEDALQRLATFTEQQQDLKSRTMGALAYPVFLSIVGTAVVTALIMFVVPRLGSMFEELREAGELPMATEFLLWLSDTLRDWGLVLLVGAGFTLFFLRVQLRSERGRRFTDLLKLRVPVAGGIFGNLAVARFCRVLGTLLRNGVPILKSLEISRAAAGNRVLSEAIAAASENISAGESLASPLRKSGHFPAAVVEMISVAEESNTLDEVLIAVAEGLELRTTRRLELMVRLLEPIMLLILAMIVLMVVIALMMPIIKMMEIGA